MNAQELLDRHGDALVSQTIITYPYGAWPGGPAVVTETRPDPNAPQIVFMVKGIGAAVALAVERGSLDSNEIGVFDHEEVELLSDSF